jgi:nitrite reductase/ring-hydroxylating ferredoxin subunit
MTVLCSIHDIEEGQSRGFASHHGPVFAVKRDGQIFVYKNECPHLGVNLEFQPNEFLDSEGALIQCSMHGALFTIEDGLCVSGPCQGDHLQTVSFSIVDDQITLEK